MEIEAPKPGRPRVWEDTRTRRRAYQERQRKKMRLIDDLIVAAVNAHWEDLELGRRICRGDDAEVLQALTEHYRALNWMYFMPSSASKPGVRKAKGGGPAARK